MPFGHTPEPAGRRRTGATCRHKNHSYTTDKVFECYIIRQFGHTGLRSSVSACVSCLGKRSLGTVTLTRSHYPAGPTSCPLIELIIQLVTSHVRTVRTLRSTASLSVPASHASVRWRGNENKIKYVQPLCTLAQRCRTNGN